MWRPFLDRHGSTPRLGQHKIDVPGQGLLELYLHVVLYLPHPFLGDGILRAQILKGQGILRHETLACYVLLARSKPRKGSFYLILYICCPLVMGLSRDWSLFVRRDMISSI
jgi:hypothetical protein